MPILEIERGTRVLLVEGYLTYVNVELFLSLAFLLSTISLKLNAALPCFGSDESRIVKFDLSRPTRIITSRMGIITQSRIAVSNCIFIAFVYTSGFFEKGREAILFER